MLTQTLLLSLSGALFCFLRVSGIQSFPPPLAHEKESALFRTLRQAPDAENAEEIRNTLIVHNLRLVAHIVRKYYTSSRCQDDLVSIGSIGLIKAVDTFDPKNGARFATYASRCIQNAIPAQRNAVQNHRYGYRIHRKNLYGNFGYFCTLFDQSVSQILSLRYKSAMKYP